MEQSVKELTFNYFKQLEDEITEIKKRKDLNEETRNNHINNIRFEYMMPIMEQNMRIMQNSPITEVETHGIIDMGSTGIKERISGKEKALPIRGKRGEGEMVEVEDEMEEGESAFSITN